MSQENVEAVRRGVQAWNADDLDAFLAELDPEVEWHPSIEPALEGGETTYRGLDGVRRAWDDYRGGAWERFTMRIQEIRDLGESVLVLGQADLTARTTGLEFTEEVGSLMTFRDGKAATVHDYLSHVKPSKPPGLRRGRSLLDKRAELTHGRGRGS
jgi:ketosteroid isomerase-like protein